MGGSDLRRLITHDRASYTDSELSKVSVANSKGVTNLFFPLNGYDKLNSSRA